VDVKMIYLAFAVAVNENFSLSNALGGLHYELCTTPSELRRFERGVRSLDALSLAKVRSAYRTYIVSGKRKAYKSATISISVSRLRQSDLAVINRYLFPSIPAHYPMSEKSWFGPCWVLEDGKLWSYSNGTKRLKLWANGISYEMAGFDAVREFDYWRAKGATRYRTPTNVSTRPESLKASH
jgi:hypothetical protein